MFLQLDYIFISNILLGEIITQTHCYHVITLYSVDLKLLSS